VSNLVDAVRLIEGNTVIFGFDKKSYPRGK
jgi:hypothetical protein